jgi:HK97 family phage major capsid protein
MSTATGIVSYTGRGLELTERMLKEHRDQRLLDEEIRLIRGQLADEDADRYFRAVMRGEVDRSAHFEVRLEARDKRAIMREQRDLTKGVTTAGGHTVPSNFVRDLFENIVEVSGIRKAGATVFTTEGGQNLPVPRATGATAASIVTEGGAIPEADPAFAQVVLGAYKYAQLVQAANELLADTAVDLSAYIARQAGRALGLGSGAHFISGTGSGQPEGVNTNSTVGRQMATGNTTSVEPASIIDVFHTVPTGYRENASWLMHDTTLTKIQQLRDAGSTGGYLFPSTHNDPPTLLGRPVVTDPTMPQGAANAKVALVGDFSLGYLIRDVVGVRFDQSAGTAFSTDLTTFRVILRTDAKPGDPNALRALQHSAT